LETTDDHQVTLMNGSGFIIVFWLLHRASERNSFSPGCAVR
jgi:hypothetical protein